MKDIVTKIYESFTPEYLLAKVIACDKDTSDYILATIDTDALPKGIIDKIIKLIGTDKLDSAMICYKNYTNESWKTITKGTIIDIDGQIFISISSGDGLSQDEFKRKISSKHSWTNKIDKEGYILTGTLKDEYEKEIELDKMKKLKTSMIE